MRAAAIQAGWLAMLLASGAMAAEEFPGQTELAAGLACYRNLDLDCARDRLEKALAQFSPERDPDFLEHVRLARWRLALIHAANDDLARAEREIKTLLLLEPDFELPPGDQPPKIRYLYDQARAELEAARAPRPSAGTGPSGEPGEASAGSRQTGQARPPPVGQTARPAPPPAEPFRLRAGARLVALFGEDAEAASPGAGASLAFGWLATPRLLVELAFDYAHHATADAQAPLQSMALSLAGRTELALGPLGLRLGGGLGLQAMGTADRYDHWGFCLAASAALVWPPRGIWALVFEVQPALLVSAEGSSFFLPLGLLGEVRW